MHVSPKYPTDIWTKDHFRNQLCQVWLLCWEETKEKPDGLLLNRIVIKPPARYLDIATKTLKANSNLEVAQKRSWSDKWLGNGFQSGDSSILFINMQLQRDEVTK